ncbi:DUF6153 family protein [Streptomyces sp. NPDC046866]|uniref:DUF6153 family protein n=1 Tax=Streptomyces sp. NPDC046866 TaxID=3154921 RepID=UPI003455A453
MHAAPPTSRRPAGRGFVLLVLALLAGVLGMHALSPAPARAAAAVPAAAHHGARHGTHEASASALRSGPEDHGGCAHPDGGSGHLQHADATCAAAGTVSPYVPPALTAALAEAAALPPLSGTAPRSALSGRAPPDLAELQLLRI